MCRLAGLRTWIRLRNWFRNRDDCRRWKQQRRYAEPVGPRRSGRSAVTFVQYVLSLGTRSQCSAGQLSIVKHSIRRRQPDRTENHVPAWRDWHVQPCRPATARQRPVPALRSLLRSAHSSMSVRQSKRCLFSCLLLPLQMFRCCERSSVDQLSLESFSGKVVLCWSHCDIRVVEPEF